MARPLNKKFFGNRNIGSTSVTTDDNIGGQGIASISWSTLGSFQGNSNVQVLTALTALPAPTIPTGVRATYTAQFEVESVGTGAGKTNLALDDTFGVASIPGMIAKVVNISGANAVFSVTTTGASRGNALALADIPQDTIGITLTKIAGTGTAATFLCDIAFRVKESTVTITEQGSGYVGTETFTFAKPGTTAGTVPAGTIVLTTDTGATGSATNEENAIRMTAFLTGGSALEVDIIRQVSARRYKVTDGTRTGVVKLTSTLADAAGEGSVAVLDSAGGEYFATKITAHRVVLTRAGGSNHLYATGSSAPWKLVDPVGSYVQISNA